ncbi:uncharacterized protein LOC128993925 [Macrosteles quadrilineatus]|uniref:uncharacterized protein LOC128993925 n=1 Tax=Macrosteles quadrilineatus TaxID=74068 RepID=UPI0023E2E299|nr:uncharacterized protein LOC128993925 [Macrosteles quadrilineatus]
MNYTLQIHGERCLYQVPPGLYELMSDMSREVLRDKPDQIYRYIANYLETLLKLRTNVKKACEIVEDVIADNQELFALVDELGMTWEEANSHARVLQRALRMYTARKTLKEKVRLEKEELLRKTPILEHSPSFIEYFESLGIDYDTANRASLVIQNAFKTFLARKKLKEMIRGSTHTIDMIAPPMDVSLVLEKPTRRNSKLLVYEESTTPSVNSGWFKPESTKVKSTLVSTSSGLVKKAPSKLVYEKSPKPSVDTVWLGAQRTLTGVSRDVRTLTQKSSKKTLDRKMSDSPLQQSVSPRVETRIPSYFDTEQARVPMISDTGQLEQDIVTLFSTDTMKVSRSFIGSVSSRAKGVDNVPSLKNLGKKPSKTDEETAKELFSMIGSTSSKKRSFGSNTEEGNYPKFSLLAPVEGDSPSLKSDDVKAHSRTSFQDSQRTDTIQTTSTIHARTSSRIAKLRMKLSQDYKSLDQT